MLKPIPDEAALMVELSSGERALIIADIHLGFELELSSHGLRVPSQTGKILSRIIRLIDTYRPGKVILLGDVKHKIASISTIDWIDIPLFFEKLIERVNNVEVILGNHDGNLEPLTPRSVKIHSSRGLKLNLSSGRSVGLIHGHAWPSANLFDADTIVMGHIHPTIELRDFSNFKMVEPVWIKLEVDLRTLISMYLKYRKIRLENQSDPADVFKELFGFEPNTQRIIVMPAFNSHLRGLSINKSRGRVEPISPILESGAVNWSSAEVFLLDGTFLGQLSLLMDFPV